MGAEDVKNTIEKFLKDTGCTDINFPDFKDDLVVATFNYNAIPNFDNKIPNIPVWSHSAVHPDPTTNRQYKIDLKKSA